MHQVPAVADSVEAGRASTDHIDLLARAQRRAPERYAADEAMLLEQCSKLRFADAERVVAYWLHHVDPDGTADAADDPERSSASVSETLDGTVIVDATLVGADAGIFSDELRRLTTAQRHADTAAGIVRTARQRRAAALIEMATRSASTPAGARRPRPLFTVLVGEDSFRQLCETAAGRILTPGALVPHLETAELEVVLFDDNATVISVSRRRTFTGALRRAIEVRDRHCQHPSGCDVPADRCDVDHIVPWTDGGRTDQFNGRLECPAHNRHHDLHDTDEPPTTATRPQLPRPRPRPTAVASSSTTDPTTSPLDRRIRPKHRRELRAGPRVDPSQTAAPITGIRRGVAGGHGSRNQLLPTPRAAAWSADASMSWA